MEKIKTLGEELDAARAKYLPDAAQPAQEAPMNPLGRDADWILAMSHALGLDSGFQVPIVPTVETFKQLFTAVRATQAAPSAAASEPVRAALAELVACKDLKQRIFPVMEVKDGHVVHSTQSARLQFEYDRRLPLAWEAARAALAAAQPAVGMPDCTHKTNHRVWVDGDSATPSIQSRASDMLTAYIELVKATGKYAEMHYIPEIEHVIEQLRESDNPKAKPEEALAEQQAQTEHPHWRRLAGLWRYGVTVLPPSEDYDFYIWLALLDTAIDERANRTPSPTADPAAPG